jgi:tetratricopeptide (TPR) repeat protein
MSRSSKFLLALLLGVFVVPTTLEAQESRFVQDAQRHLALAMTRTDEARIRQDLERALDPIRRGLAEFPESAQLHYMHAQALTGLSEWEQAAEAFERAEQLDPSLAEEMADDRLNAWAGAAQRGLDLLAESSFEEAARYLELANRIRADRPESHLELGRAYINLNRWADAEQAYRRTIDVVDTYSNAADITDEDRERYPEYASTARTNLSIVLTQLGAQAFDNEDYEAALRHFREAAELSPHSRDHWLNASLAAYNILHDLRDAAAAAQGAELEQLNRRRLEIADFIILATDRLGTFDPRFADLRPLAIEGYRAKAEIAAEDESLRLREQMLAVAEQHQALDFTISDIALQPTDDGVIVSGVLNRVEGAERAPVQLRISVLNRRGDVLATETVSITDTTADQARFEARIRTDQDVIGWRYEVVR